MTLVVTKLSMHNLLVIILCLNAQRCFVKERKTGRQEGERARIRSFQPA